MQNLPPPFRPGDVVHVRGARWRLAAMVGYPDCHLLRLDGLDAAVRGRRRALLYPFDRPRSLAGPVCAPRPVRWRRARRALCALAAQHAPWPALQSAATARIDLKPFQLEPALAVLTGRATRILLADEVGLGKTIQAALIVAELAARDEPPAVLIVAPAGLVGQWAAELTDRFALEVSVTDAAGLARTLAALPRGANPWLLPGIRLVSMDFVKRPEVLQALEPVVWDLVIVDEAHHATATSDRGMAVAALAARGRLVVLLTATPHPGDDDAFRWLCGLGDLAAAGERRPLVVFRRSRAEVGLVGTRRTHLLRVRLAPEERHLHGLLERYVRSVWREAGGRGDARAQGAMVLLLKRALSSAQALALSAARRLERLGAPAPAVQRALPFADEDEGGDQAPDDILAAPGLADAGRERAWLGALVAAALAASRGERKLAALERLVRRTREPLVIFTEYRDTLLRIAARLGRTADLVVLHGGLGPAERQAGLARFLGGGARVLLATDVAGEGLNLHTCARLVVSVELPWMPTRLEQRLGRVDRLGQARTVHAVHLVAAGTAEEGLLARLVERLARIRAAVGAGAPLLGPQPEMAVARAWIEGCPLEPAWSACALETGAPPDLRAAAVAEVGRLETVRRLAAAAAGRPPTPAAPPARPPAALLAALDRRGPWIAAVPPGRWPRGTARGAAAALVAIVRCPLADGSGRLVAPAVVAVRVPIAGRCAGPWRRRVLRQIAAAWAPLAEPVLQAARRAVAAQLVACEPAYRAAHEAAADREAALARAASAALAGARRLVQPGLFDARALRGAHEARRRAARRRELCARRLAELEAAATLELAGAPELLLLLVLPSRGAP